MRESVSGVEDGEVVRTDILRFNVRSAFPDGKEIVAGNIPYNLPGALIRKLLGDPPPPRRLSLVVQKEGAGRWTAPGRARLAPVAAPVYAPALLLLSLP